jgi:hypothetical protein
MSVAGLTCSPGLSVRVAVRLVRPLPLSSLIKMIGNQNPVEGGRP